MQIFLQSNCELIADTLKTFEPRNLGAKLILKEFSEIADQDKNITIIFVSGGQTKK